MFCLCAGGRTLPPQQDACAGSDKTFFFIECFLHPHALSSERTGKKKKEKNETKNTSTQSNNQFLTNIFFFEFVFALALASV